jgi:colanic acid/amylovoran biosynthesis glycosyltransferase
MSEQQLKILCAGISWPVETFLAGLLKGLADTGAEVTIACKRKPDDDWLSHPRLHWLYTPDWQSMLPRRCLRFGWMMGRALVRAPGDLRLFRSYIKTVQSRVERLRMWYQLLPFAGYRWDVIYFPWNFAAFNFLPLFDLNCPVVVSCRGSQINISSVASPESIRAVIADGLRATFQRAAAIHCVSEAIQLEALRYGLDPEKARVIHPAVDVDFFSPSEPSGSRNGTFRVVTTGSLVWVKGYEYALQSIRHLLDRGIAVEFDLIGDGPERQRILYTIQDLGLEGLVHLHGRLKPNEVREQLRMSDAFLLSSLSEGISNAVLEAMACGLPVVTTDCGGMREAVTDGKDGFVVPVRDPMEISVALEKLALNPYLRRQMGQHGRATVASMFDLKSQISRFSDLYTAVSEGYLKQVTA